MVVSVRVRSCQMRSARRSDHDCAASLEHPKSKGTLVPLDEQKKEHDKHQDVNVKLLHKSVALYRAQQQLHPASSKPIVDEVQFRAARADRSYDRWQFARAQISAAVRVGLALSQAPDERESVQPSAGRRAMLSPCTCNLGLCQLLSGVIKLRLLGCVNLVGNDLATAIRMSLACLPALPARYRAAKP